MHLERISTKHLEPGNQLLVIAFIKYITSRGLRALCNGPETLTQWKCGSVTDDNVGEDGI